jgi:hypothetical protein
VFGWPDPNTGFDQSEHALYTCYFINIFVVQLREKMLKTKQNEVGTMTFDVALFSRDEVSVIHFLLELSTEANTLDASVGQQRVS